MNSICLSLVLIEGRKNGFHCLELGALIYLDVDGVANRFLGALWVVCIVHIVKRPRLPT